MRLAKAPAALGLGQDGVLSFKRGDDARTVFIAEQGVVALHALDARAQPASLAHMRRDRGADLVIRPIAAALHQQAPAFVLDQPVSFRRKVHIHHAPPSRIQPVDPSPPPHHATLPAIPTGEIQLVRALQADIRRAMPAERVKINPAAGAIAAADPQADLGDGIAFQVGHLPFQFGSVAGRQGLRWPRQQRQPVLAVVMLDVQADIDGAGIAFVSQGPRPYRLARVKLGAGHQ